MLDPEPPSLDPVLAADPARVRASLLPDLTTSRPLPGSWPDYDAFESFLGHLAAERVPGRDHREAKARHVALSPAIFPDGQEGGRTIEAAVGSAAWSWLDCEDEDGGERALPPEPVRDALAVLGWRTTIYSSARWRPDNLRYRVVVQLDRRLTADEHKPVWRAVRKGVEAALRAPLAVDAGKSAINSFMSAPGVFPGAVNPFFWRLGGDPAGVDALLRAFPPPPEARPAALRVPADPALVKLRRQLAEARRTAGRRGPPSLHDPSWVPLAWLDDLRGAGAHHDRVLRLLSRVWIKSDRTASPCELAAVWDECDGEMAGYLGRFYATQKTRKIREVMKL